MSSCIFDPVEWLNQHKDVTMEGVALGMFHCPSCGEMVIAGVPHPDYSILDNMTEEDWERIMNDDPQNEEVEENDSSMPM